MVHVKHSDFDAMVLAKASRFVNTQMFEQQCIFSGTSDSECQRQSVPNTLLSFVREYHLELGTLL